MKFCPSCERMLTFVEKLEHQCPNCGYTQALQRNPHSTETTDPSQHVTSPILIHDPETPRLQTLPVITQNCPNCNNLATVLRSHTGGTDDDISLIQLFRCLQCGHHWRQED